MLTTRFHFKTKELILSCFSTLANLASLAISFVSGDKLETIKCEQVEKKSMLKFLNKSLQAK